NLSKCVAANGHESNHTYGRTQKRTRKKPNSHSIRKSFLFSGRIWLYGSILAFETVRAPIYTGTKRRYATSQCPSHETREHTRRRTCPGRLNSDYARDRTKHNQIQTNSPEPIFQTLSLARIQACRCRPD